MTKSVPNNKFQLSQRSSSREPQVKQQAPKLLVGLKSFTSREMNSVKDRVYSGCVFSVTFIEEAYS